MKKTENNPINKTSLEVPKPLTKTQIEEDIKILKTQQKSQAKRINHVLYKYKGWIRTKYETTPFQEPVMWFERRSGEVEFYEKATKGTFDFVHSDGKQKFIILVPHLQKKFGFGERMFRGYYCHEDYPLPLPYPPELLTEQVTTMWQKAFHEIEKQKVQAIKATGNMWRNILIGVAIIIGAITLYVMLKPDPTPITQTIQYITEQNLSAGLK